VGNRQRSDSLLKRTTTFRLAARTQCTNLT